MTMQLAPDRLALPPPLDLDLVDAGRTTGFAGLETKPKPRTPLGLPTGRLRAESRGRTGDGPFRLTSSHWRFNGSRART